MQEFAMTPRFSLICFSAPFACGSSLAYASGLCLALAVLAAAQETPPLTGGTSPLGIRQQRAERMQQTLNRAKELLIQKRMGDITKLLDQTQLDTATDGQKALLADIRALLELLLNEKSDKDKAREEFERLSQWKQEIEKLIRAERGERRESDRLANKEKALSD